VRILHVNKFVHRRGGAEAYMQDLAALQARHGHRTAFFGMSHPDNDEAEFASTFPAYVEFDPEQWSIRDRTRALARMTWSRSAARGIDEVVDRFAPDVVHLHNIYHQLSPSILRPLARRRIPAVMTLHDYKLACPTYRFLANGETCEACVPRRFYNAPRKRCKDGSLFASGAAAAELTLHTVTGAYGSVARFICPSRFMADKMTEARVFPDRLRWIPHFVDGDMVRAAGVPGRGVVSAGRLSPEKGVDVLVEAAALMGPDLPVHIAGDGPAASELRALAADRAPWIRFHGRLPREELHGLMRSSAVFALPSRWYENQPMIVLEAFACGVPVVGTALGGTPELISPGVDGALVPADDPAALAAALTEVAEPQSAAAMGREGRAKVERDFSPAAHLARLDGVYAEAAAFAATISR
jgi:glycosyltransferase involved in cell wall biosynthesis